MNTNLEIAKAYESIEATEALIRESGVEQSNPDFNIGQLDSLKSFKARVEYCRQNLKYIGRGSSRMVFMLPNGHVLKLAWNRKGVAQNDAEGGDRYKSELKCFAKSFKSAEDGSWLESEFARKCSKPEFLKLNGFSFDIMCDCIVLIARQRGRGDECRWWNFTDKERAEAIVNEQCDDCDSFLYDLNEYIGNYDASSTCGDFLRIANWGVVNRNGNDMTVISDSGLTPDVADNFYW